MKSAAEIRQALIQIAERKGRPHYNLVVVRDVIEAMKSGTYHPLKDYVIAENSTIVLEDNIDPKVKELMDFCSKQGMQRYLADAAGVHYATVNQVVCGNRGMSDWLWNTLSGAFDKAKMEYEKAVGKKKSKLGGRVVSA